MNGGVLIQMARRVFVRNFYLKFIAAVLTLALYIWVSEDRETVVAGYAPVRIVVPDEMTLVSDPIDRVKVTFRGRWSDINRFDPSDLDPIRIDLSPGDKDTVVSITSDMIGVPPAIRVTDIEPSSMYVDLEDESFKNVPIRPRITGDPRPSYTVANIQVSPRTVTLRGPDSRLEAIESVRTERIDISDRTESLQREVRLDIDDGLVSVELDSAIQLDVDIETEEISETLSDLPVDAVNTSYETSVDPQRAELMIRGPESVITDLDRDLIRVEIDLSDEDQRPPGTFSLQAEVVNLPPEVELRRIHPERFRVVTTRPQRDAGEDEGEPEDTEDG